MDILKDFQLESNSKVKMNFGGGDLSSDSGLLLIKEFAHKLGFEKLVKDNFKTIGDEKRFHKDYKNLCQVIYQIFAGYFNDDDADELTNEPIFKSILNKSKIASQPTLSRFFNRMNENTAQQFNEITKKLRSFVYSIKKPENVLFDLDSTLLRTYGNQEGEDYNYHYASRGYHPLLCYDGLTGDLLKTELRDGTTYCCNGVKDFMQPLLDEYLNNYSNTNLYLRGDSGFASPELYYQCETNAVSYAIKLKTNNNLYKLAGYARDRMNEIMSKNIIDYAVVYDEFLYKASSWKYPRRVVVKVEKPTNQFIPNYAFIVTNMDLSPKNILKFYCNRGNMENFIKESKNGFNFESTSSNSKTVNANRLQLRMLAYNLFNYFKRIVLPSNMRKMQMSTIRTKLIKIASKVVKSARYVYFKLCSSCPYKKDFYETLENIRLLPRLE